MHLSTLLRKVEPHKGFVIASDTYNDAAGRIEMRLRPDARSKPICPICRQSRPAYDRLAERVYQFVPLWNIAVVLLYSRRRVDCPTCGIKAEYLPWVLGKSPICRSFAVFLASWAKRLPWKEVGQLFSTGWEQVYTSVQYVVEFGLKHRDLSGVEAIGIDEVQYSKGHKYMTLVYQICGPVKRLLYVGKARETSTLRKFFVTQGDTWCGRIRFVCTDMWKPYRKAIREKLPNCIHILDRFHVVKMLNEALDKIRRQEQRRLRQEGYEDVLLKSKYCFLKNPENLTPGQKPRLKEILQYDLKSVRAYLLREAFQAFWQYTSPYWARQYLRKWCTRAMRSRLGPMKKFVGTMRRHEDLLMNWFRARKRFSSGVVEGLNRKVNLITRRAYGYRSFKVMQVALMHTLGGLPEPESTHRFS